MPPLFGGAIACEILAVRPSLLTALLAPYLAVAPSASPQAVRYGVVMADARDSLEHTWTDSVRQVERAYCVVGWSIGVHHVTRQPPYMDDSLFRVYLVSPAAVRSAGTSTVDFDCPEGVPELHTHTPTTCLRGDPRECVLGGPDAFSCQPSRADLEKLQMRNDRFGVIQCDRRVFRFYIVDDYRRPPPVVAQPGASKPPSSTPDTATRGGTPPTRS